jgi:hypothetical protein
VTGTLDLRAAFSVRYGDTWARELWHGGARIWSAPYNGPSHVALVDPATVWADTAGTVPLSLGGVCARLDAMLPGMPALLQTTEPSRPRFGRHPKSGVRNLLTGTDSLSTQSRTVAAVQHTLSFRGTGTVTLSGASTAGPLVGTGAGDLVSLTFTPSAGTLTLTVSGSVTEAQLEVGAARSAYQAVTTQWDVTEAGQADVYYLEGDGADDWMQSAANIDLSGSPQATLIGAIEILSRSVSTWPLSFPGLGTGAVNIIADPDTSNRWRFIIYNDTGVSTQRIHLAPFYPAPDRAVITGVVTDTSLDLRRNAVLIGSGGFTGPLTAFSNARLTILARNTGQNAARARYYGHVLRGGAMTAAELATAETYLMRRIGLA